jgi:hypothetical protein
MVADIPITCKVCSTHIDDFFYTPSLPKRGEKAILYLYKHSYLFSIYIYIYTHKQIHVCVGVCVKREI